MNKSIIPIKGMHCRSCEILIEEKLKEIPSIKNVQVNYKKANAIIYSKQPLDLLETNTINKAIQEAGYDIGVDDSKSWISLNPSEYWDLAKSLVLLLILYFIANKLGLFNINAGSTNNPSNLSVVLLIGLTAGVSTCMALVGGLILGISARHSEKHPEATPAQKFRPHLFFVLGRIIAYFLLGGIIGLIGKAFQLSGPVLGFMTIAVGAVMLIMGAQLTEIFPRLSNGGLTLPSGISKFFGIKKHHDKEYSHANSMLVGALTFFLPCGFTQAMQLYAMSTGNFWSGAFIMGAFALGTAPGLLGIGGLTSVLKGAFAKKFFKFTGLLVVFLAIFNISNGYRLTGWKNIFAFERSAQVTAKDDPNVKIENSIQVVRMTQSAGGYKPNKFTIKKGIPVKWIINSTDSNTCAASISMPKQNVRKALRLGENIIEFTPKEIGDIKFTCSMGMYSGKFTVVENDKPVSLNTDSAPKTSDAATTVPTPPAQDQPTTSTSQQKSTQPATTTPSVPKETPKPVDEVQAIKAVFDNASYTADSDITPNVFTVKAGKPVRFEITANANGAGCMSTIMIPGLVDDYELLEKGKTIKWEFTPTAGTYDITCAMGVSRGVLKVI